MGNFRPRSHEVREGPRRGLTAEPWSFRVVGAAIAVHRALDPGLLESAYQSALAAELDFQGVPFEREWPIPILYRDRALDTHYRLDFLVGGLLIVELKAVETILPVHTAQLLTYLRISGFRTGLLINFNVPVLRQGIIRRVL